VEKLTSVLGRVRNVVILSIAVLGLIGCATMATVEDAPLNEGVSRVFPASYQAVSRATRQSLPRLSVTIKRSYERPNGLVILVDKWIRSFSWGEVGRVFIEKSSGPSTKVYVRWEKRSQLQITGTSASDFSRQLFRQINAELAR
jgi:hypothetical protein